VYREVRESEERAGDRGGRRVVDEADGDRCADADADARVDVAWLRQADLDLPDAAALRADVDVHVGVGEVLEVREPWTRQVRRSRGVRGERIGEQVPVRALVRAEEDAGVTTAGDDEVRVVGVVREERRLRVAVDARSTDAGRDVREVPESALRRVAERAVSGHERVELAVLRPG